MLFIVLFSVLTTFSNFQATFSLITPKVFGIFTPNFTTKVRKIWLNFWWVWKNFGGWCCGIIRKMLNGGFWRRSYTRWFSVLMAWYDRAGQGRGVSVLFFMKLKLSAPTPTPPSPCIHTHTPATCTFHTRARQNTETKQKTQTNKQTVFPPLNE